MVTARVRSGHGGIVTYGGRRGVPWPAPAARQAVQAAGRRAARLPHAPRTARRRREPPRAPSARRAPLARARTSRRNNPATTDNWTLAQRH